jgi:hypothetical protein
MTPRDYYDADPPEDPPEVERERERICEECERESGPCKTPGKDCSWLRDCMAEWAEEQARAAEAAEESAAESREDR